MIVAVGFAVMLLFLAVANVLNKRGGARYVDGPRLFIWVWLAATLANGAYGAFVAGIGLAVEAVVFVIAFGAPAGVAWYVARMIKRREAASAIKPPGV
jgi:asparagine N-glycosylation enzyme membrane subunit Stt3